MRILITVLLVAWSVVAGAQGLPATERPPTPVEVTNFPDEQNVSGTVSVDNLPAVQAVSVENLPAVQAVSIVNADREQVEIKHTLTLADGRITALIFGPERQTVPLERVPSGKKLVLTDLLVTHNIVGETDVLGANILRAAADTNCASGPVGLRHQLRVGPGAGTNLSLTTGLEYLEGEQVCLATGGIPVNPVLGLSYSLIGYLVDM